LGREVKLRLSLGAKTGSTITLAQQEVKSGVGWIELHGPAELLLSAEGVILLKE